MSIIDDINNIVWWIPFKNLRNSVRNILLELNTNKNNIEHILSETAINKNNIEHILSETATNKNNIEHILSETTINKNNIDRLLGLFYSKDGVIKIDKIYETLSIIYNHLNLSEKERKEMFSYIYKHNVWSNSESLSGPGSTIVSTKQLVAEFLPLLDKYNIKTILDAPCGDMNWMKHLLSNFEHYIGIDIVPDMIENHKKTFSNVKNAEFKCLDLIKDDLDKVDLIFSKDCIQHLSNEEIFKVINNIKKSNSKYLLIGSNEIAYNNDRVKYGYFEWKNVNLEQEPFYFPKPLVYIDEKGIRMGLWKVSSLPDYNI